MLCFSPKLMTRRALKNGETSSESSFWICSLGFIKVVCCELVRGLILLLLDLVAVSFLYCLVKMVLVCLHFLDVDDECLEVLCDDSEQAHQRLLDVFHLGSDGTYALV